MTETALPQPSTPRPPTTGAPGLWQSVLVRALVTVAFGLVTVFWAEPGAVGLSLAFTCYFLAVAAAQFYTVRILNLPRRDSRRLALLGGAALLAMSAVVVAISLSTVVAAWFGAAALVALGAGELFSALHRPAEGGKSALRSDWIIAGALGIGTGLLLPFFIAVGPHGLMGVAGGGAIMSGALWMLSAFTLRHDGARAKAQ